MDIQPRHAGHHHLANIKYGYIIAGISLVYALVIAASHYIFIKKWLTNGKPAPKSIWARTGRIPVWAHITVWTVIAVGLSFYNVKELAENYNVVIKRVGRLGYALVPLDVLLAIRPSVLGGSYLEYVSLHKWLSRLIFVLVLVHGGGYFVKWLVEHAFWRKTLKWANFLGVVVAVLCVILGTISMGPIRRRIYRWFYILHNITVFTFLALVFFHARPGVGDFVILLVVMLAYQLYQKLSLVHNITKVSIVDEDSSTLRLLRLSKPTQYPSLWYAGSHVRLGYEKSNFRYWLYPTHPYTLCSLPLDSTLDLVVKKGYRFQVFSSVAYTLSSPLQSVPPAFLTSAENVNILCGGSGISLGIPIFRYLKHNSSVIVNLFWCISNKEDAYILKELNVMSGVEVYVTGSSHGTFLAGSEAADNEDFGLLGGSELLELESLETGQTVTDPALDGNKGKIAELPATVFHRGRPKLDEIFGSFSETDEAANKWIIACGPNSLVSDARAWSAIHNVQLYTEVYDM